MSRLKVPVTSDDHFKGPEDAPLTLVEYGDFQCPFCRQAHLQLRSLEGELPSGLRFVFRHFPLAQVHEYAFIAAMGAESAALQGKFWEMHDMLYEKQELLSPEAVVEFARALELNMAAFQKALSNDALLSRIKRDFMSGVRSGVNGTPGFYLNEKKYEGPLDPELFKQLIAA